MKTNDLKKGTRVKVHYGWEAEIFDNVKGNSRMCRVFGLVKEIGGVYAHNITDYLDSDGVWKKVEHTKEQIKLKKMIESIGLEGEKND
jgi:hypothetical protein